MSLIEFDGGAKVFQYSSIPDYSKVRLPGVTQGIPRAQLGSQLCPFFCTGNLRLDLYMGINPPLLDVSDLYTSISWSTY